MEPTEVLYLIVEASLALAGFAGVVNALTRRAGSAIGVMPRLRLVNLLATSFAALFLSLLALGLHAMDVEPATVWRIVSAAGLPPMVYFPIHSIREIRRTFGPEAARRSAPLWVVNVPVFFVCVLQVWNVAVGGLFWPFFAFVVTLFAVGSWSFVFLVLYEEE